MDILNFISWIKGGRVVTSVNPSQTLIPVGLKDSRRDDKYLAGAISVQDLAAQIAPEPIYKVYTALLTQSGGDDVQILTIGNSLIIGVTYVITDDGVGYVLGDFTNVGAPNNNLGTSFVATGTTPNNWGIDISLVYNTGAPVVNVLENTIGNVWFTYDSVGQYFLNSDGSFTDIKTFTYMGSDPNFDQSGNPVKQAQMVTENVNRLDITTFTIDIDGLGVTADGLLVYGTPIEIRVYN